MDLDETFSVCTLDAEDSPLPEQRSAILLVEGCTSSRVALPSRGELVIGRGEDAQIHIKDPSKVISRHHARLLVSDDSVQIIDNDSHNGTLVNGIRVVGHRALRAGDSVTIGDATLVLLRQVSPSTRRGFLSESQFLARGEEETARATRYQRSLSLLHVDLGTVASPRTNLARAIEGQLLVQDVAGFLDAEHHLRILLPESDLSEATTRAATLLQALGKVCDTARIGLAAFPENGIRLDVLLSAAQMAAEIARPGSLLAANSLQLTRKVGDRDVVIADPAVRQLYALLDRLAPSTVPVLIYGETGTGKELAAGALHEASSRRKGPLISVNCAAIGETLIESTLFGHRRGAFTGASGDQRGLCEAANGGTLFLDEIAELSLPAQAKLLRVLEAKKILPLGETRERDVDVRFVAATHQDLLLAVEQKRFRQDLYFRLAAAVVHLPPLRERTREMPILARLFLQQACKQLGRAPLTIDPSTMIRLANHAWPGNLRELRNAIDYAAAITPDGWPVLPEHLPAALVGAARAPTSETARTPGGPTSPQQALPKLFRAIADEIEELERLRITEALAAHAGVKSRAAEALAMPLRTFMTKCKHYGLGRAEEA